MIMHVEYILLRLQCWKFGLFDLTVVQERCLYNKFISTISNEGNE